MTKAEKKIKSSKKIFNTSNYLRTKKGKNFVISADIIRGDTVFCVMVFCKIICITLNEAIVIFST